MNSNQNHKNELATGIHPDTGLYHVDHMPLSQDPVLRSSQDKLLAGVPRKEFTIGEALKSGRDHTLRELGGVTLKPDHVYRTITADMLDTYNEAGAILAQNGRIAEQGEDMQGGVSWYLGAVALGYGAKNARTSENFVLETPATPELFAPANDFGNGLAMDPLIKHMKSSGADNPVPMSAVQVLSVSDSDIARHTSTMPGRR